MDERLQFVARRLLDPGFVLRKRAGLFPSFI
jgi:hypothetical protein